MKKHIFTLLGMISLFVLGCMNGTEEEPLPQYDNPAINQVTSQIKYNPNDAELYLTRATLFSSMEMYDEAITDMKKAISFDSASVAYRHVLSDYYYDSGKHDEAVALLGETITMFPASEPTILKLTEMQYLLDRNEDAIQTIGKLVDQNSNNAESYYMLGKINERMDKTDEAIKQFKKALSINDKHTDSMMGLGNILSQQKSSEALKYLEKALELSPSNPDIVFEVGNYYRFKGDDEQALKYYKQVVLLDHQYTDAHLNSGMIYMDNKSFKKAYDLFNIAVETDPTYPSAYYYKGLAAAYMGDNVSAKADLQQALDLSSDFVDAKEALMKLE